MDIGAYKRGHHHFNLSWHPDDRFKGSCYLQYKIYRHLDFFGWRFGQLERKYCPGFYIAAGRLILLRPLAILQTRYGHL